MSTQGYLSFILTLLLNSIDFQLTVSSFYKLYYRESEIDHRFMNRKWKVYIDNLPNDTTREDVESLFRSWGEIKSVWISNPPAYSFLEFENLEDAEVAVSIMDG